MLFGRSCGFLRQAVLWAGSMCGLKTPLGEAGSGAGEASLVKHAVQRRAQDRSLDRAWRRARSRNMARTSLRIQLPCPREAVLLRDRRCVPELLHPRKLPPQWRTRSEGLAERRSRNGVCRQETATTANPSARPTATAVSISCQWESAAVTRPALGLPSKVALCSSIPPRPGPGGGIPAKPGEDSDLSTGPLAAVSSASPVSDS